MTFARNVRAQITFGGIDTTESVNGVGLSDDELLRAENDPTWSGIRVRTADSGLALASSERRLGALPVSSRITRTR